MKKFRGFTLAEVLITLAIIGIVAAITLPSLLVNVNEKAWDAQRKALHARLAQAIGQMKSLGGYGQFETDDDGVVTEDTAAESFIIDALSKVYKINNVCGADKLSSCGIPNMISTLNKEAGINFPTKISELNGALLTGTPGVTAEKVKTDTKAAAFETVNGESVAVFYNPDCTSDKNSEHYVLDVMCVNFIYDLNGSGGPNEVGKDIGFITAFYNKNSTVVAPIPHNKDYGTMVPQYVTDSSGNDAQGACKTMGEDLRLPNKDELSSMVTNAPLINMDKESEVDYWSSSVISKTNSGIAWRVDFPYGYRGNTHADFNANVRCIRK